MRRSKPEEGIFTRCMNLHFIQNDTEKQRGKENEKTLALLLALTLIALLATCGDNTPTDVSDSIAMSAEFSEFIKNYTNMDHYRANTSDDNCGFTLKNEFYPDYQKSSTAHLLDDDKDTNYAKPLDTAVDFSIDEKVKNDSNLKKHLMLLESRILFATLSLIEKTVSRLLVLNSSIEINTKMSSER